MKRRIGTEERRSSILNMLHEEGRVMITPLVQAFNVSEVSIRKDLAVLEERKLLVRVKGGAIAMRQAEEEDDLSITHKKKLNAHEKARLGKYAAALIKENETIILDSGTTMMEIARNLDSFQNLTIITNSLDIALILSRYERFNVIVLGGSIRVISHSTVGMLAEMGLKNFYCDKLFLGVDSANTRDGLSTPNIEEASLNQAMIASAREVVAVFDSSKIGRRSFAHIADLSKVNTIITDSNAPEEFRSFVRNAGIDLHIIDI